MRVFAVILLSLAGVCAHAQSPGTAASGDRARLLGLLGDYLAALVAHDPSRVPFVGDAKFVENIEAKRIGDGLWQTVTAGPTSFALPVPDPVSGQIGFLGMIEAQGEPVLLALRLATANGEIVEAEHLLARNLSATSLRNLQHPRPALLAELEPDWRMPRDELIRIGLSYYDAVDDNDGTLAPFAADCVRRENGRQTTNNPPSAGPDGNPFRALDCETQLTVGAMGYIDSIDNRRVEIADPVTGLVFGLSHFRHAMRRHEFPITGLPGFEAREVNLDPFDLPAAHIFKIAGGEMHEIEAMGFFAPYDSASGWE